MSFVHIFPAVIVLLFAISDRQASGVRANRQIAQTPLEDQEAQTPLEEPDHGQRIARQSRLSNVTKLQVQLASLHPAACKGRTGVIMTLVATRHAEARHNVAEAWREAGMPQDGAKFPELTPDEKSQLREEDQVIEYAGFFDAVLSKAGINQVQGIGREKLLETLDHDINKPDIVFVSPLRRTLLTAAILYQDRSLEKPLYAADILVEKRTQAAADTRRTLPKIMENPDLSGGGSNEWVLEGEPRRLLFAEESGVTHMLLNDGMLLLNGVTKSPRIKDVLVSDVTYFGVEQDYVKQEGDETYVTWNASMPKGNSETQERARHFLEWVILQGLPTVAVVSHKGFLRELEIAAFLYDDLGNDQTTQADKHNAIRDNLNQLKKDKEATNERKRQNQAWGLYGNAETRLYELTCPELRVY